MTYVADDWNKPSVTRLPLTIRCVCKWSKAVDHRCWPSFHVMVIADRSPVLVTHQVTHLSAESSSRQWDVGDLFFPSAGCRQVQFAFPNRVLCALHLLDLSSFCVRPRSWFTYIVRAFRRRRQRPDTWRWCGGYSICWQRLHVVITPRT